MWFYYLSYGSMIVLIPGIIFSIWAQFRVSSTFKRYSKVPSRSNWTANEMSQMLLERNDCRGVSVRPIRGNLTDNYNPSTDVLSLSETVYNSNSIAALGVAAHECGHAVQKHSDSLLLAMRSFLVPVTNIGSRLALPVALFGVLLEWWIDTADNNLGTVLVGVGILLYSLSTIFALITLPVEIDASRRALKMMSSAGVLESDETRKARAVLYAAALTYVASLVTSLLYLLRFILILSQLRRKD